MADFTATGQQLRPYGGPGQTLGNTGRGGAFTTGINGDPSNSEAAAYADEQSARFQAQVPHQFRPSSVLTPLNYSHNSGGNAMSAQDAAKRFPDGTPMGNPGGLGTSESSYQPSVMLRMAGQDSI